MAIIEGYLKTGTSKLITDCSILLKARKTTNSVLMKTEAHEVATDGYYKMDVLPCEYDVFLSMSGHATQGIGTIKVLNDSTNGTLNDFLLNPSDETEITPIILTQVTEERIAAQKAATAAKTSETNAAGTLSGAVKKTGDTMTSDLTLQSDSVSLVFRSKTTDTRNILKHSSDGSLLFSAYNSSNWYPKFNFNNGTNTFDFVNLTDVTINGKSAMKIGDGGILGLASLTSNYAGDWDFTLEKGPAVTSTFSFESTDLDNKPSWFPTESWGFGLRIKRASSQAFDLIASNNGKVGFKTLSGTNKWDGEFITTKNSTVDSNGFYKKASPVLRLYSEVPKVVEGFTQAEYGLVNSEANGVYAKKIGVGHYEIHGSLGFAKEGWYVEQPKDANGNFFAFIEYSTDENNVITVKTSKRKFDLEACLIVGGEPMDIQPDRWIDLRLEMPAIEVAEEIEGNIDSDDKQIKKGITPLI